MTTTSAFLQQTFWVPGMVRPWVLPAPAHDGWSPPAFPSRPAQTVPRPAPASRGSHLPGAGGAGRRAKGQVLLKEAQIKTGRGKSYKIPHNTLFFAGSLGNTSRCFFFLGSASDSRYTFSHSGSFELGSFSLNHLMSFYTRCAHSSPSVFPKASINIWHAISGPGSQAC